MSKLIRVLKDGTALSVHPNTLDQHVKLGWSEADDQSADDISQGTDELTNEQLRDSIKEQTGKAPSSQAKRETLLKQYAALTKPEGNEGSGDGQSNELASNGLTRREIISDLEAMGESFAPDDSTEDLGALRDLKREERDSAGQSSQA